MKDTKNYSFRIIDFFLKLNFNAEKFTEIRRKENLNFRTIVIYKVYKVFVKYIIFTLLKTIYYTKLVKFKPLIDEKDKPIISLTTFPLRINNLWMVVYCLFNQTLRPGKIILTLSKQEFPNEYDQFPNSLKCFLNKGLEVIFVDENLKPHNKYFFTFQKYPNRDIITVDDDLLYYSDTVERLVILHKEHPQSVCSNRIQKISLNSVNFEKTENWLHIYSSSKPSHYNFALGYGAVFYPANFKSPLLFNKEKIKSLSLLADDLWLKSIEILADIYVVCGEYYAHPVMIPFSQKIALRFINSEKNVTGNDDQWNNLNIEFELLKKMIKLN